tara:strand:- start:1685 stop:1855 length:171 start_codon:yes stop_codon:yes gene_type:complete
MDKLKIDTDNNSLAFLWYLATIKRFDASDLCRVIESPHNNNQLYTQFMEERRKDNG